MEGVRDVQDKEVFHAKEDNQTQEGSQDGADREAVDGSNKDIPVEELRMRQVAEDKEDIPWEEGDSNTDEAHHHKHLVEGDCEPEERALQLSFC